MNSYDNLESGEGGMSTMTIIFIALGFILLIIMLVYFKCKDNKTEEEESAGDTSEEDSSLAISDSESQGE